MATNNAINAPFPFTVTNGGTGIASLIDHGVLLGSGTAAIDPLGVATTGQLLIGVTTADAAFSSSNSGDFAFTSATAATNRILTISNTDNSNTASAGTLQITVGGASAGDPALKYTISGVTNYSRGIDNSATDSYKVSNSTALGTTDSWIMDSAGERTMPLQCAFQASLTNFKTNVTGDGTVYTIAWDQENFDTSGSFAAATFTAPVTGRYRLTLSTYFSNITGAGFVADYASIITTNRTYSSCVRAIGLLQQGNQNGFIFSVLADMTAGDTATTDIKVSGGTKTIGVYSAATDTRTYFCGSLIC